jgi:hypothetical protein
VYILIPKNTNGFWSPIYISGITGVLVMELDLSMPAIQGLNVSSNTDF